MKRHFVAQSAVLLLMLCFVLRGLVLGQEQVASSNHAASGKAYFQLVLQGPFVICEKGSDDLLILVPDPTLLQDLHYYPHFYTALWEHEFTDVTTKDFELKNLPLAKKTTFANNDAEVVQYPGTCPKGRYYMSLKVPRPLEIWRLWPVSAREGKDCKHAKPRNLSTEIVLRYDSVDLGTIKFWDGTDHDVGLIAVGTEAMMTFEMNPVGDNANHDSYAFDSMAKMASVDTCVSDILLQSHAQSMKPELGSDAATKKLQEKLLMFNTHQNCHAPIMLLCNNCPAAPPLR
jgi:hypothetical protein